MDLAERLKEANLYIQQGLSAEAIEILEEIIKNPAKEEEIQAKAQKLLTTLTAKKTEKKYVYLDEKKEIKPPPVKEVKPETKPSNVDKIFKEAEYYANQGLYKEASNIYKTLPQDFFKESHPFADKLRDRIKQLETNFLEESFTAAASTAQFDIKRSLENATGLMEAGFFTEAISELKSIIDSGHHHGLIYAKIGEAYISIDQPYDAIDYFTEALKDNKLNREVRLKILYQLAITYEKNGSMPQAIAEYERINRIDPNYGNVRIRLEALTKTTQKYGQFYYLIKNEMITPEKLDEAREKARHDRKSVETVLLSDFGVDKFQLGESLSEYYKVPFKEYNQLELEAKPECVQHISEHFLRSSGFVPIYEDEGTVIIAIDNPHDMQKGDLIKKSVNKKNKKIEYAVSFKDDIEKFIDFFYDKIKKDASEEIFEELGNAVEEEVDEKETTGYSETDNVVVKLANTIIDDAFNQNTSDIHIECMPEKLGALIRFRIDGDCKIYQRIPVTYKKALVSRIKIMSSLDIAEKRLPQDGKIKFKTRKGQAIELRVATLPTIGDNEDVVMRILASAGAMPLDKIGLLDHVYQQFEKMLALPYGLVFVVGPTGSGKTTTLHAALNYVNRENKKIWTAEDPVEIVQKGLRQVQVKPGIGLNFSRVMRAFLRADPDIIMVGETRDEETAHTVIEASLTGHLVFSTLHTNSAPETLTRLLGMGMDPFNFSDALIGVLAQRLGRRLCANCKEQYEPTKEQMDELIEEYGDSPIYPLTYDSFKEATMFKSVGCKKCDNKGYKGRLGIHELLTNNDEIRKLIQGKSPVFEIFDAAKRNGMMTLKQDGIQKVLKGLTDINQVRAVCIK